MVAIVKRFEKDKDGKVVKYKVVNVQLNSKGEVYLNLSVGVPKTDKKSELTFKLTDEEITFITKLFEQIATKRIEQLIKQEQQPKQIATKENYEIEKIPDFS